MARRSTKQINADKEFVRELRKAQKNIEDKFGVKISDRRATQIMKPFIQDIFNPFNDEEDIRRERKKRNPFKLL